MFNIGIDLGGTNIKVGVVNEKYEIVGKSSIKTNLPRPAEAIADSIAEAVELALENAGVTLADVNSVGIGTPGAANRNSGIVLYSNNLGFNNVNLGEMLKQRLDKDIYVENDANAAAYGEYLAGAGKGYDNVVVITLGTGVGGGIIIDGKIYTGFNFCGAEIGHTVIEYNGRPCSCGRKGCWEAYSSATALIRMTKEKIEECRATGRHTIMADQPKVSGRTACDAMRAGDEAAKEVYDNYIKYLASGLATIINIFQPEVISLGGGVSGEGQSLIDSLLPIIRKEQYGGTVVSLTDIRIAKLGNDAGIIGAAVLGL